MRWVAEKPHHWNRLRDVRIAVAVDKRQPKHADIVLLILLE